MSFFMTEEQKLLQQSVHEFCLSPAAQEAVAADNARPGEFPRHSWDLLGQMGFIGLAMPPEYGGQGMGTVTDLIVLEALNQHAYPAVENLAGHLLGCTILLHWGGDAVKEKYLTPLAKGDKVCCGAATDPAGSFNMSEWGITYRQDGDEYVVTGEKVLVTNAHAADIKIILAKELGGVATTKAFIIEAGTPGLETGHQEKRIIPTPQDWGTIRMKDVRIPAENVLSATAIGGLWIAVGFNAGALISLGLGQAAFQMALGYTTQRTNSGRPLNQLQVVAHRLVNIAIHNEIGRASIYTAAQLWDEGRYEESARLSFMNKVWVTESVCQATHDATVLHGGVGYTVDAMIGVLNAMAVSTEIAECPPDVLRDFIAGTYGIEPVWKAGRP